ncbi:hypothetical protein [Salipaludibacillus sp. CF4.18]|uniref:hypothetical protein n=1 Tax=Salipaludibacillus sp. CF4.18 TaxID=3373081 RepID=UPI003EE764D3
MAGTPLHICLNSGSWPPVGSSLVIDGGYTVVSFDVNERLILENRSHLKYEGFSVKRRKKAINHSIHG